MNEGDYKIEKRGNKNLRIAMIGHKVVPSRRGGIERVLTIMCPLMIKKGHQVTCFNRSGDKVENEYVKTVKGKKYRGVQLKRVITINKRGLAAMTSSFLLQFVQHLENMMLYIFMQKDQVYFYGFRNCLENDVL